MRKRSTGLIATAAMASIGLLLGGCAGGSPSPGDPSDPEETVDTLRVATWGGSWSAAVQETVGAAFEAETGIKVEYIDANPGDSYAKIIAARGGDPGFDVATFNDVYTAQLAEQGLIQTFEISEIPNADLAYEEAIIAPGTIPALNSSKLALAYIPSALEEAGVGTPDSWEVLWDPALAGRVGVPDAGTSAALGTIVMANLLQGNDDWSNLEPGYEKLSELDIAQVYTSSSTVEQQAQSGDVWAWITQGARIYRMQDAGIEAQFIEPNIEGFGTIIGYDTIYQIPVTTSPAATRAALQFVGMSFEPELLADWMERVQSEPTVAQAAEILLERHPDWEGRYLDPADVDDLFVMDVTQLHVKVPEMTERWPRIFG